VTVRRDAAYSGMPAALPLAAAATLFAARWLPVEFAYRPNPQGIVSVATEARYPVQQETFWAAFALGAGSLAAWAIARALRRAALAPARVAGLEAAAAAALVAALGLPAPLGVAAALGCAVLARAAAGPRARPPESGGVAGVAPAPAASRRAGRALAWGAALLALALLLTPALFTNLWNATHGVPDAARTADSFGFQGEVGQHLAWADALLRGELHGRDFFCLYGPLYDLGTAGFWRLFGRSIAGFELYFSLTRALGLAALLWLAAALSERRAFALVVPALVPWVNLRMGLPLLGLLLVCGWLRTGRRALALAAGGVAGLALLYSQEFGLAFAVASALAMALHRDARAAAGFAAAALAAAAPLLAWYAAHGALLPMLRDLAGYPATVMAGYAKLPFPALAAGIPLRWAELGTQPSLLLRLAPAVAAASWGALLLALGVAELDPRRPLASAREALARLRRDARRQAGVLCAVFGLLCFRTALGRSDLVHVISVQAPAALLVALACDRLFAAWRAQPGLRAVVAVRAAALALFVLLGGFAEAPRPLRDLERSARDATRLWRHGNQPIGSAEVMRVVRWLELRLTPEDRVLALPNDGAYYYLLARPSPIRFVMGHQIATAAQREEVLAALRRAPPRFVLWDDGALRVDGLPDERVLGAELLAWIDAGYAEAARLGRVRILERRAAQGAAAAGAGRAGRGSSSGTSRPSAIAPTPPTR